MDICLRVLKENNKSRFSGTVYWSHPILPFGIVACTFFSDNVSRNSCIRKWKVQTSSYTLKRCPCYEPGVTHSPKTLPHITLSLVSLDLWSSLFWDIYPYWSVFVTNRFYKSGGSRVLMSKGDNSLHSLQRLMRLIFMRVIQIGRTFQKKSIETFVINNTCQGYKKWCKNCGFRTKLNFNWIFQPLFTWQLMATLQSGESGDNAAPRVGLVRKLEPVPVPVHLQSTTAQTARDLSSKHSPATIFLAQVITFHLLILSI